MRVLIIATDLYRTVGGGETVYRKIIAANSGIEFVYFRMAEREDAQRPRNARSVPLLPGRNLRVEQPFFPQARLGNLCSADAFARSVAGESFDVIELPDYFALGQYLRDCLGVHDVRYKALVLSMHGNISTSLALGWNSESDSTFVERELELEQFEDVDARYAISRRYMRDWQARANLEIEYFDPLSIVGAPAPVAWAPGARPPGLYCIGRTERRKGNDLFVEIVRWLDRSLYSGAWHVGALDHARDGTSSQTILESIAQARETKVDFMPSQDRAGLNSLFGRDAVVVLPVRYDSLNLMAIEALFAGVPTVVSSGAGVCEFLDERLPELPYVKLDLRDFYGVVADLEALLRDYAGRRRELLARLAALKPDIPNLDLGPFYEEATRREHAAAASRTRGSISFEQGLPSLLQRAKRASRRVVPGTAWRAAKRLIRDPKGVVASGMLRLGLFSDAKLAWYAIESTRLKGRFRRISLEPESSVRTIDEKVRLIHKISRSPVYRCNVWRELARLELLRGNELVSVSYELRLMRLLGGDRFGRLRAVTEALERHGFPHEARACLAQYGDLTGAAERVHAYLHDAYRRCLTSEQRPFERIDDRRKGESRVAVIVSLYNAHAKLRLFLTMLSLQTLVRKDAVEVILVDSGSKGNEYEVLSEFLSRQRLNLVYVRSAERETIQAAWNRGIHLARAPYLVFLGVDETLYPEALEVLADEFDRDPETDWVMANSLVTEVDDNGVLKRDVMTYDRNGGTQDYTYLETCYLSWVGGMYRKSIHERFGYYDESFRAAGDTEFKNRVLPHIKARFVPRVLGLFLNYPDERTTASPLAEIEDARAWYLHRTPGGVRYAFERRDPRDALALLYAALGYRKSYCRHISSDIEYAGHLYGYLSALPGERGLPAELGSELAALLESLRRLEWSEGSFGVLKPARVLVATWRSARKTEQRHARLLAHKAAPVYKVLNDNRFEQHSWLWPTL